MDKHQIIYTPVGGVCSRLMKIDIENDIITQVEVQKGCQGNSQGIAALMKGMHIDDAIKRLDGIKCGRKNTSCPDQLAQALKEYLKQQ